MYYTSGMEIYSETRGICYMIHYSPTLNNVAMSIVFYINPINSIILYYCKLLVTHLVQQNDKMCEMITATLHFHCHFLEHSAVLLSHAPKPAVFNGYEYTYTYC